MGYEYASASLPTDNKKQTSAKPSVKEAIWQKMATKKSTFFGEKSRI